MAKLEIIQMPDPRLKKPSRKVSHVDEKLRQLVCDMDEALRENDGVGLAAVQVGVHKRFFLVRIPEVITEELTGEQVDAIMESDDEPAKKYIYEIEEKDPDNPDAEPTIRYIRKKLNWPEARVIINPKIIEKEGSVIDDEGCLSDSGFQGKIERCRRVLVSAMDLNMDPVLIDATGFEARCLQHEIDHLDGIIYLDRMIEGTRSPMPSSEAEDKIEDYEDDGMDFADDEDVEDIEDGPIPGDETLSGDPEAAERTQG